MLFSGQTSFYASLSKSHKCVLMPAKILWAKLFLKYPIYYPTYYISLCAWCYWLWVSDARALC
jgi:hypothetical protein